jgi:parallel beta-helix repeat protein
MRFSKGCPLLVTIVLFGCSSTPIDFADLDQAALSGKRCGNGVCNRNETCSSCPADCGPCAPAETPPKEPPPATTTAGVGPQASITCPAGALAISPGEDIAAIVSSSAAGTAFCVRAGIHYPTSPINPRTGQSLTGEHGAILDGSKMSPMPYDVGSTSIIRGWNCSDCSGVTIKNLVVRDLPGYSCIGTYNGGNAWTIDHNEVSGCLRGVLGANNTVVSSNYIHHNVGNVTSPVPAERGGGYGCFRCTGATFLDNEIAFNGPEQKIAGTKNVTFRGNFVHHNGDGIWYDGDNVGSLIERNVVEDNGREGIFYEVSGQGIIRDNVVRRNGITGIFVSTSRDTEIHHNTLEDNWRGITFFLNCDARGVQYDGAIDHDLTNDFAHDNVVRVGTRAGSFATSVTYLSNCTTAQAAPYLDGSKHLVFEANTYAAPVLAESYWVWGDRRLAWSGWQGAGNDATGTLAAR